MESKPVGDEEKENLPATLKKIATAGHSPHLSASSQHDPSFLNTQLTVLLAERQRLTLAQRVGGIGTFDWDISSNSMLQTPELAVLYGLSGDEFVEQYEDWTQRIYPEDLPHVEASLRQAVHEECPYQVEYRVLWPDGSMHWLLARGDLLFDEKHTATHMLGVNIDITERKEVEQQLGWQTALLKESHDACIIQDPETNEVLFWNQGATALYGWSEEEALGRKLYEVLDTQFPEPRQDVYRILGEQKHWEGELVHKKRDGTRIFVESRYVQIERSKSASAIILQVNRDITKLKHALTNNYLLAEFSKYLTLSLDYHQALANVARLVVSSLADWCRIELLGDGQELRQLTVSQVEVDLEPVWENVAGGLRPVVPTSATFYPRVTEQLLRTLANDEQDFAFLCEGHFSSAIIVPVFLQAKVVGALLFLLAEKALFYTKDDLSLLEDLAGRVALAIERARMYQDLQDLNRNLESIVESRTATLLETTGTLRQLNVELGRSNQELQDFAHVASHDLQEPLRKIQAFGNLLEEEHGKELGEGKMYLERMRNAAARMQVLINDLLAFARITTKAQPFVPVDLNSITHEVLGDLETSVYLSGGNIEIGQLPTIEADPLQMRQMLQNLLGNALKFRRVGIPLSVKVYAEVKDLVEESDLDELQSPGEAYCLLAVEDNGIGFDEKYLDRIFTVFQRLHGKNEYEGTGIGLAVVRKIVLRHRGTITAKSVPGAGAKFLVRLPVSQTVKEENPYAG